MARSTSVVLIVLGLAVSMAGGFGLIGDVGGPPLFNMFIAVSALGGGLVFFGIVMLASSQQSAGAASTTGGNGSFQPYESEDRQLGERTYEVFYKPLKSGKNGHPSSLQISVEAEHPTRLQFNAENWFDRLCKGIGLAQEHQTGDAAFDDLFYVRTPQESYAERFLADPAKRAALVELKGYGFQEIRVTGHEVQAQWAGFSPTAHDRAGLTDDVAERLFTLTKNLPPPDAQLDEPEWRIDWHAPLWTFLLLFALTFLCAFWFQPVRIGNLLSYSLPVYGVGWLVFGWFAAFLLRGRSNSHDQWVVLMAVSLVALLLGSIGTVSAVNAIGDTADPVTRKLVISDKRISRSKKSTSYYVCVPEWNGDGPAVDFSVSSADYHKATPGKSELHLITGPGALGIEWLESKEIRF